MTNGDRVGNLSSRGSAFADPSSRAPMLDVVCDLWHSDSNPNGYLSLGVAENTLMHDELIEYMTKTFTVNSHALTYGDGFSGSHDLRQVLAAFINRHFNPTKVISPDHVAVTSGVGPAVESCAFSLCDPGDGVLLARPFYGNFLSDLSSRARAEVVGVSFGDVEPFGLEAVSVHEKALLEAQGRGTPVKALLLCNPHNPLGRCYPREVLIQYMRLCQKYNLHLISDEIYALSVWANPEVPDAPPFTSVLSIDGEGVIDPSLVHVLWGMSKDFGSNGLRLGCIVSQSNPAFRLALEANSYFTSPSALSDRVTTNILADATFVESLVRTNCSRLASNYAFTAQFLRDHGIPFMEGCNAGFFVWVDLFKPVRHMQLIREAANADLWKLEGELHRELLGRRVFLASGAAFGADEPGWFRIVFAHHQSYLEEGLNRVAAGLGFFVSLMKSREEASLSSSSPKK